MNSYCTSCQITVAEGLYCPNCGAQLLAPPTPQPTPSVLPQGSPVSPPVGFAVQQKTPMPTGKLVGFIGGGLVVALIVIFGAITGINNARIESEKDAKLTSAATSCTLSSGLSVLDSADVTMRGNRELTMDVTNSYGSDLTATDVACVLDALERPSELTTKMLSSIAAGTGAESSYSWNDIDATWSYSYYQGLSVTLSINDSHEGY